MHSSRGIAVADLDNDDTLEIVTVNMHEDPSLLKQYAPTATAILVDARSGAGRAAIGARIRVAAGGTGQISEVRSGGYHISQSDLRVHFGIGEAGSADVAITWPDGSEEHLGSVQANTLVTVTQGQGISATAALGQ